MAASKAISLIKRSSGAERLIIVIRCLVVAALGVSICVADQLSDQTIRRVEERYNGAHTLAVQFVQNYEVGGRHRPAETGLLRLQKQGKMRWDYTQPSGKLFISDGKSVYLYTAGDNRVEKVPIRDTEDMRAPLAFLLGRLDFKKEFRNLRASSADHHTYLDASAKSDQVPYEKVRMLVRDDGSISQLAITGRDGSAMMLAFDNERINPKFDPTLFRFVVPAGAEVVDSVEFRAEGK